MAHPPLEIKGSVGGRVRVILGKTGSEWLLLLDEDNGNFMWQTKDWSSAGVPDEMAKQINVCFSKGRTVNHVDFGPTGSWFVSGMKWYGADDYWCGGGTEDKSDITKIARGNQNVRVSFGSTSRTSNASKNCESYVIMKGENGYKARNVDRDLLTRIERVNAMCKKIHFVRLFHDTCFFISDDFGTKWKRIWASM